MRVLILGASGFIGSRIALAAKRAGWQVRAAARHPAPAALRMRHFEWVKADFASLIDPAAWSQLLQDVDAVVNCVGVLQDAAGDSIRVAHILGPSALLDACASSHVGRFIQISAIGADQAAGTRYAQDKLAADRLIQASDLEWVVVRPSLVVGREVYGGTALIRGLAGAPFVIPLVGGEQTLRPLPIEDLASFVVGLLSPSAPAREVIDVNGPESLSLAQLVAAYRAWLGFGAAPTVIVPPWVAWPLLRFGDLAGWLGWTSALRSTSLRQIEHGAASEAPAIGGIRAFSDFLDQEPASVQDRWHARLFFVRPFVVMLLATVWFVSGLVALGPGAERAMALLHRAGLGPWSNATSVATAGIDLALGALLLVRRSTALAAIGGVAVSLGYVLAGTVLLPDLWADPLGPLLKAIPIIGLSLVVAATDSRR